MKHYQQNNLKKEIKEIFDIYFEYYGKHPSVKNVAEKLQMDEFELLKYIKQHQNDFKIKKVKYKNGFIPIIYDINYDIDKKNTYKKNDNKIIYVKEVYDNNFWLLGYILDSFDKKNSQETIVNVLDLLKIDYTDYGFELNGILMDGFFIPVNGIETLKQIFKYKIKII